MNNLYDVIVAGAGPAGATAAYFLGRAGQRVLVIEKAKLPRYKACGGGVSLNFLRNQFPFSFEPVISVPVTAITYALGRHRVTIPLPGPDMAMVMRAQFDAFLLAHAQAEVWQGAAVRRVTERADAVEVETAGGRIATGRFLIGADGANSVVARAAGLRRSKVMAGAIEVEVPASAEILHRFAARPVFIFGEVRLGYLWIFPKADHLSVGIAGLHPKPGSLQKTLRRVMADYDILLDNLPRHGHPIPIYTGRQTIATGRILLAGDAAGMVDPFSGEGIRPAIKSGRLAAEAILSGHPKRYPRAIYRQIGLNHMLAAGLSLLFYRFQWLCFMLGAGNPFATQGFIHLFSGRSGYPAVLVRIFGTLPLFLLIETAAGVVGLLGGANKKRRFKSQAYAMGW